MRLAQPCEDHHGCPAGTTVYGYAAGGQLWTEDGPFASDTVTNYYLYRVRTNLSLARPTGVWTNM